MAVGIKASRSDIVFNTIITTILVIVLLVTIYPLIYVVSASVSDPLVVMNGEIWLLPKDITLDGYKRVFSNNDIMTGYRNTIVYTLVGTTVNILMTIAGAYPLSRKDFVGKNVIMVYFTVTMFFSGGLIPSYINMQKLNLVNNFWVMILPGAVSMYNMIITRTFFQNTIPQELQEAAKVDGCTNIRLLIRIVLPLSIPIVAVMAMFYGVAHWNAFFDALIYIRDRSRFPLQLFLREILIQNEMAEMMMEMEDLAHHQLMAESLKYAVVIVASAPVLMLYPFLQRYFIKGVMIGALKG